jgi:EAL domain-containing protein (putative c-di-GMP-specific phosphodiesterase class I)
VTETVLLPHVARAIAVMHALKALGVTLSLDDFGTGYSSINYVRQFLFDSVKIDRALTATVATDSVARSTAGALIDVSHGMDLTVVAEGVETAQQLDDVRSLGADRAQGFHLGHPMSGAALVSFLGGLISGETSGGHTLHTVIV